MNNTAFKEEQLTLGTEWDKTFPQSGSAEKRRDKRAVLAKQRSDDYRTGGYALAGGVADAVPDDAPFYVHDYYDYYKTKRGYHPRSLNSNGGWNATNSLSLLNGRILHYASEIESAVFLIHGEEAHSCYFSRDVFKQLKGDNKELLIIHGAVHLFASQTPKVATQALKLTFMTRWMSSRLTR